MCNKVIALLLLVLCTSIAFFSVAHAEIGVSTKSTDGFKTMLRARILEILDSWPAQDQYAVMFFIYPNQAYQYGGFNNVPEFTMLYRLESDLSLDHNPFFAPSDEDEERWNIAFWDQDLQESVVDVSKPNAMADALFTWYQEQGIENIGYEDASKTYNEQFVYIGRGPNGLPELLDLVAGIAADLQSEGIIETKFGRPIPIVLSDFEFTWYMIDTTRRANPHGEADEYLDACKRMGMIP